MYLDQEVLTETIASRSRIGEGPDAWLTFCFLCKAAPKC